MQDLQSFSERVLRLWRDLPMGADGRRPTQEQLASAVGLARAELNRRLNGKSRTPLSCDNVRAIVLALAQHGAIATQDAALDLLRLADCVPFTDWQQPPLDRLAPLSPRAQAQIGDGANSLPYTPSRFVGREVELDAAARLLRDGCRLLTVTGAGGMGKTRFALELAHRLQAGYPQGAAAAMLSTVTDAALVERAVATSLGLREEAGRDLRDTLADWLRPRQMLLVLDNCEHLLPACAALAAHLLVACPSLVIITTSRQRLGIAGETSFILPPLSLPPATAASPQAVSAHAAVQLLVERATRVRPGFQVTAKNATAVVMLSCQLEGIPLAIELAAPLFAALSVEQITKRFDRFRLLRSDDPTIEPRQQTLAASIAWSYDRLTASERSLLRRLAVFVGGFALEAVEALDSDPLSTESAYAQSAIYNLQSLISKSLVGVIGEDEQSRYLMLETIREYALARLREADEQQAAADWHANYYRQLAETAAPELVGAAQSEWLSRLDAELGNLNAALVWLQAHHPTDALRLATAMWRFWYVRGYLSEGRTRLQAALAAATNPEAVLHARALIGLGTFAFEQGDYGEATNCYRQSLALWREAGDQQGIASVLNNLGLVAFEQSLYAEATTYGEESLAIYRQMGDISGVAAALANLGRVMQYKGDFSVARQLYEEALETFRQIGDTGSVIVLLGNLGNLTADAGDYADAQQRLAECLAMARALNDEQAVAEALDSLAGVVYHQGDTAQAIQLYQQSLTLNQQMGDKRAIAYSLEGLATVSIDLNPSFAACLLAAADRLRQTIGAPRPDIQAAACAALLHRLSNILPPAELAAAQQQGLAMDEVQASAYALKEGA